MNPALFLLFACLLSEPAFAQVYAPPIRWDKPNPLWERDQVSVANELLLSSYRPAPLESSATVSLPTHSGGNQNPQENGSTALVFTAPKSGTYGILGMAHCDITLGSSGLSLEVLTTHGADSGTLVRAVGPPATVILGIAVILYGPYFWSPDDHQDKALSKGTEGITLNAGDRLIFVPCLFDGVFRSNNDEVAATVTLKRLRITLGRTPFPYRD